MEIVYIIIVLAIIFGIAFIRANITRKAREARASRERGDAARFLSQNPAEPSTVTTVTTATPAAPAARIEQSAIPRYAEDEPPPPPPPGW
jgi:hypothetical protein